MSTILYDETGKSVIVKDACQVTGMLKQGFTVEPPDLTSDPEQEDLDFEGPADVLDVDLDIVINDDDLG